MFSGIPERLWSSNISHGPTSLSVATSTAIFTLRVSGRLLATLTDKEVCLSFAASSKRYPWRVAERVQGESSEPRGMPPVVGDWKGRRSI